MVMNYWFFCFRNNNAMGKCLYNSNVNSRFYALCLEASKEFQNFHLFLHLNNIILCSAFCMMMIMRKNEAEKNQLAFILHFALTMPQHTKEMHQNGNLNGFFWALRNCIATSRLFFFFHTFLLSISNPFAVDGKYFRFLFH